MGRQEQVIEYLVDQGLVEASVADDLRSRHENNAATALLTESILDEEKLLQELAVHFNCPPAGYSEGLFIEHQLLDQLDPSMVREYELLPVRQSGGERVDVIVVEPLDKLARNVVEARFKMPLRQYVWPRVRFLQARHYFLGDELPAWTRSYLRSHPVTLGYATSDREIDVLKSLQTSASLQVLQWDRDDVRRFIEDCFDRDTLLKVLLGYAGHWLSRRIIAVFTKSGIQPYFMEEWPELEERYSDVDQLRQISSDCGELVRNADTWQSGDADSLGITPLFDTLGVTAPPLLIALPVHIGGRCAMTLIGVPTDRQAAMRLDDLNDDFELQPLASATTWVGEQLEEVIRLAKSDILPPPAERIPPLPESKMSFGLGIEDSLVEQKIARRKKGEKIHRWEIVDISHVIEASEASEASVEESETIKASDPDVSEVEISDVEESRSTQDSAPKDSELKTSATSYGMPSLSSDGSIPTSMEPTSEARSQAEAEPAGARESSSIDEGWGKMLSEANRKPSMGSEASDAVVPEVDAATADSSAESVQSSPIDGRTPHSTPAPTIDENTAHHGPPTSDAVVTVTEKSSDSEPLVSDDIAPSTPSPQSESSAIELSDNESSHSAPSEPSEAKDDGDASDTPASSQSQVGPPSTPGLQIPNGPSGLPLAQILRRPKQSPNSDLSEISDTPDGDGETEAPDASDGTDGDHDSNSVTGRTILGHGEIPAIEDSSADDESAPDATSWLDEVEDSQASLDSSSSPGSTMQMDSEAARTQTFGALIDDMESESKKAEGKHDELQDRPSTIPVDALEEIESGPMAIEIEESMKLLNSRDKEKAFAAAEHLAVAGAPVIESLKPLFPGKIFVDRYQFTVETMPPVNEHGPVLETLVRIGQPSIEVVSEYLDASSLERRFYATYLLTELSLDGLLDKLCNRLFDRDQQTRTVAQRLVHAHRYLDDFQEKIVEPLRAILEDSEEDFRIEIAANNLRRLRDIKSIPALIDALQTDSKHVRDTIHQALRQITLQPLAPSPSEWRRWWFDASDQSRWEWLVEAMNSDDEDLRHTAFDEIQQIPGLELNYHPDQPPKLRTRAQQELRNFLAD